MTFILLLACARETVPVVTTLQSVASCPEGEKACVVDVDGDGAAETFLMSGSEWQSKNLINVPAIVYEFGAGCNLDGQVVTANSMGFYVISLVDSPACVTDLTLTIGSKSDPAWWQSYPVCTDGSDAQGVCKQVGEHDYLFSVDWDPVSGPTPQP